MGKFQASVGTHPVERAIHAGKILPSRREFYMEKHAKNPKATEKLLDKLEAVFEGGYNPEEKEYLQQFEPSPPMAAASPPPPPPVRQAQAPVLGSTGGTIVFEDTKMAQEAAAWALPANA